jgi:ABC-type molybdenum transport system ATPase subunit/photorepair protein PhrA
MLKTIINKLTGASSSSRDFQERKDAILSGFVTTLHSLQSLEEEQEKHIDMVNNQINDLMAESDRTKKILSSTQKTISKIQNILD